jgi:hypothetical protein
LPTEPDGRRSRPVPTAARLPDPAVKRPFKNALSCEECETAVAHREQLHPVSQRVRGADTPSVQRGRQGRHDRGRDADPRLIRSMTSTPYAMAGCHGHSVRCTHRRRWVSACARSAW